MPAVFGGRSFIHPFIPSTTWQALLEPKTKIPVLLQLTSWWDGGANGAMQTTVRNFKRCRDKEGKQWQERGAPQYGGESEWCTQWPGGALLRW